MKSRKANRLKGYDYSKDNLYFVTTCVKDMECCFGDVVGTGRDLSVRDDNCDLSVLDDESAHMILNEFGLIAKHQIEWLDNQYPYVNIHSSIVMPNHVHLVIEIDSFGINNVETSCDLSVRDEKVKIKSLSELMGAYKTTSSKLIHLAGYLDFQWHRSFHDHIIRDEKAYLNITNYITTNPEKWEKDKFYK